MKFIISKSNKENFERDKLFQTERVKDAYDFLCSNAAQGRLISFEAFEREMNVDLGLEPVWGFFIKENGNDLLYMKVEK
jgi:hypothetical protein